MRAQALVLKDAAFEYYNLLLMPLVFMSVCTCFTVETHTCGGVLFVSAQMKKRACITCTLIGLLVMLVDVTHG